MIKRINYRAYPTKNQAAFFQQVFGQCRFTYNWALDIKTKSYEESKANGDKKIKSLSVFDISKQLTQLKKQPEYAWLNEGISVAHNWSLQHLDLAFKNFFRRVKNGEAPGYPSFKSKHKSGKAFSFHQGYTIADNKISVPKSGWLKFKKHRGFFGTTKTVTVKQEPSGKYYISIVVDDGVAPVEKLPFDESKILGIDVGVVNAITLSDGTQFRTELDIVKDEKRLLRAQRDLSRKVHGKGIPASNNFKKQKIILAKRHEKIRFKREHAINNVVFDLVKYLLDNDYCGIAIRKYDVKGMVDTEKVDKTKKRYRKVKRILNKSILNGGMGMLNEKIRQKCEEAGLHVLEMKASDSKTTHKCYICESEDVNIDLKSREIECKKCGHIDDIDKNAAKNVAKYCLENQAA